MNKKYIVIGGIIFVAALVALFGFLWHTKTSDYSNSQAWTTYTQRLDSGDVISIDYPTRLVPQAYQISSDEKTLLVSTTTNDHISDIRFQSPGNKIPDNIDVILSLPKSQAEIEARKKFFEGNGNEISRAHDVEMKRSVWHLGAWTAYETSEPYGDYEYYFNINNRDLIIHPAVLSKADVDRIMSSVRLNGVQISKLDPVQNWDWPVLKVGK